MRTKFKLFQLTSLMLFFVSGLAAQQSGTQDAAATQQVKAPVTTAAREILAARNKFLVAAAEEMPENKYSFKPTPQHMGFGETVAHVAENNYMVCSKIAGSSMPQQLAAEKDGKARVIESLRKSFDFCSGVLNKLDESQLGEKIDLYGGSTKGKALFYLASHWADHYAGLAMYLRLNGLLPPTAKQ
ncbi:MAG TPA: DinB family protein [Terriglobales bacterium]|nr:DinB family protein [Terriglobales bacterium]